jgi:hypothetical protein
MQYILHNQTKIKHTLSPEVVEDLGYVEAKLKAWNPFVETQTQIRLLVGPKTQPSLTLYYILIGILVPLSGLLIFTIMRRAKQKRTQDRLLIADAGGSLKMKLFD